MSSRWKKWLPGRDQHSNSSNQRNNENSSLASKRVIMRGEPRVVYVNVVPPADKLDDQGRNFVSYVDNRIRTTKYTIFTFVPKNLFEQFRRLANFYFLALVVLQSFSVFEVSSPIYAASPIAVIVLVTAAKDAFEDWKRRRADRDTNYSQCIHLGNTDNMNFIGDALPWLKRLRLTIKSIPQRTIRAFKAYQVNRKRWLQLEVDRERRRKAGEARSRTPSAGNAIYDDFLKSPTSLSRPKSIKSPSLNPQLWETNTESGSGPAWRKTSWKKLRVGDFVVIKNNETVPADIVVLSTSEADGVCYVETKNLDGETNLKIRSGFSATSYIISPEDCASFQCELHAEAPNNSLYTFKGFITILETDIDPDAAGKLTMPPSAKPPVTLPISVNELLLRGCLIRNTEWVIGLVVYTGIDTKLMMNSGVTPSKRSMIEKQMNPQVLASFVLTFFICLALAICNGYFQARFAGKGAPFIPETFGGASSQNVYEVAFLTFWSALILIQNIIPISLYVTSEVVKTMQSYFIHTDADMYYELFNAPCVPKTWTIADDLGQIEYIFSDKTGTLTRNVMDFRKCSINGVMYGEFQAGEPTTPAKVIDRRQSKESMVEHMKQFYKNPYLSDTVTFVDEQFAKDLYDTASDQSKVIKEFFTHLAVCHTVLSEYPDDNDDYSIVYKAQSPDEAALVSTAKDVGFAFIDRVSDEVTVNIMDKLVKFEVLDIIEFTSTRKRMSVIVKTAIGTILLYCKGADSIIYERLGPEQSALKEQTLEHLESFATQGLRTLCLAYKIIQPAEYAAWSTEYQTALALIDDREAAVDKVAEKIERNLFLLGATAIEDRLQDGVPECIARLANGGIKIWVLTGDKMETAINIGFSCNLLKRQMVLVVIKGTDLLSTRSQLKQALAKCFQLDSAQYEKEAGVHPTKEPSHIEPQSQAEFVTHAEEDGKPQVFALIIDGASLKYALDKSCKRQFVELATRCKAVICCRVSPLQKAQVVGVVMELKDAMTLAIGDGANDVSMIQRAHIGVGIQGQEGMQAVMASDFAIAQFRYLNRLLLVHGRWSYFRTAEMVLLMFYKNVTWTLVLVWYQFYCGFSAQILYDYFFVLFYNLVYTSLPPIMVGVFDQDIRDQYSLAVPQVYRRGIKRQLYSIYHFALYVLDGIYQSLIVFYLAYWLVDETVLSVHGYDVGMMEMGTVAATLAIVNANFYAGLNTYHWTWLVHFGVWGSCIVFLLFVIVYSYMSQSTLLGVTPSLILQPAFWLSLPIGVVVSLLPRAIIKFVRSWRYPSDIDLIREINRYKLDEWQYIHADVEGLNTVVTDPMIRSEVDDEIEMNPLPHAAETAEAGASNNNETSKEEPQRPESTNSPRTLPFINLIPSPTISAQHMAHRINAEFDRIIASPIRRGFETLNTDIKRATSVFYMKTGQTQTNTGFAFSQEPGVASHLSNLASPTAGTMRRRAGRFQSVERLPPLDTLLAASFDDPNGDTESHTGDRSSNRRRTVEYDMDPDGVDMSPPYWTPASERRMASQNWKRGSSLSHSVTVVVPDSASISSVPVEVSPMEEEPDDDTTQEPSNVKK